MRFTNWLQNGQGSGDTESGVYTIGNGLNETRAVGARYFIPSEDEWYKAAYYDPRLASQGGPPGDDHYWYYPTCHDDIPTAEPPPGGVNSANFDRAVGDTTDVGAYADSTSFYGTFDQGGNVKEWNEAVVENSFYPKGLRGGSWSNQYPELCAHLRNSADPGWEDNVQGFRVASVMPDFVSVYPDSYLVTRGEHVSGGIPELAASDNQDLSLRRLTIDIQSRTEFSVNAISPTATPSSLEVTLEGSVFARSTVNQTIELYDYVAAAWEQVDTRAATRFTDSTVTVAASGDLSRFVQPGTMCVEARIRYQSPSARQQFSSNTDQFLWTIGQ
jgi:hypothetical protein